MPRPQWNQRYQNRASNRSTYVHPKIYGATAELQRQRWQLQISLRTWAIVSATAALAALGWLLFASPAFAIRRIDVVGSVSPDVLAEIQQLQGQNLLAYSTGSMTAKLRTAQSSIDQLAVYKGLPDTLRIEVGLRTPVLRWKAGDDEYLLDGEGIPFQRGSGYTQTSADESAPLVVDLAKQPVTVGRRFMSPDFVRTIGELHHAWPLRFPVDVDHYELGQSSFSLGVITSAGWTAELDTTRSIEPQLVALGEVFAKFHDTIRESVDLRVEGRAYYK